MVTISVIFGCFAVNNLTFGLWRAKTHQPPALHASFAQPPTRTPMDWQMSNQHYFTPHRNHMGMASMGDGYGGYCVEAESPTKRLGYR